MNKRNENLPPLGIATVERIIEIIIIARTVAVSVQNACWEIW